MKAALEMNFLLKPVAYLEEGLLKEAEKFPELLTNFHTDMGVLLKHQMDETINERLNDKNGHVRNWQMIRLGSRGGYVAISPKIYTETMGYGHVNTGPNGKRRWRNAFRGASNINAITRYLEGGHRIRRPRTDSKRYTPKINLTRVEGRMFYNCTSEKMNDVFYEYAKKLVEQLKQNLEGLGT